MSRYVGDPIVFTGNAHPELARDVCAALDVELGCANVFDFANGNTFVQFLDNIRERDVFLIQPGAKPVNHHLVELLIMIDAARRASAGRITAVVPYFAYGRSDKKDQPRVPITARLFADLIQTAGADRMLTMDLHAGQIQGFFHIPTDELTAQRLLAEHFRSQGFDGVVVSPDFGGAKRARAMADLLNLPVAIAEKRRTGNDDRAEMLQLIGEVGGRDALIIDDEIVTAGTLCEVAELLRSEGAQRIRAAAIHGILSPPALERLAMSPIASVVLTDTLSLPEDDQGAELETVSVAPLLGEAIRRIHEGDSVGALFR
ncbi:MAG: ribose-phosphate pyrophosphokinase [Chloroflexi bacterium]|nr:ribose-phosphate pyrophosphokinase [Chloroflexota bacterium]MDE2707868.1 ribose-phosphate pyrophosphokinase [Chloroflexota bacterium]MXV80465.1 ribose-phosphate pyrophosphokinase [Chloroflexota bacterium]MYC00599.1 ribose-phosphate pyrophosphokinase [Chloroflexota bacterium]